MMLVALSFKILDCAFIFFFFFFNDTATTEIYTLSLHDALPIFGAKAIAGERVLGAMAGGATMSDDERDRHRSEEHTSELQSPCNLVCRLLLEKKKQEPHTQADEDYKLHAHTHRPTTRARRVDRA